MIINRESFKIAKTSVDYSIQLEEKITKLKKVIEIYKEANAFYGEIENHFQIDDRENSDIGLDKGSFARKAQKAVEELLK